MRIEQILGIIGGIFGLLSALFVMIVGGLGEAFNYEDADTVISLGLSAFIFSIIGLVGGVITDKRTKIGGGLMIIAGICGFISISAFYLLAGPFFLIGGVLALLHSRKKKEGAENKIIDKEKKSKFCPECGAKIEGTSKFCPECGNKL